MLSISSIPRRFSSLTLSIFYLIHLSLSLLLHLHLHRLLLVPNFPLFQLQCLPSLQLLLFTHDLHRIILHTWCFFSHFLHLRRYSFHSPLLRALSPLSPTISDSSCSSLSAILSIFLTLPRKTVLLLQTMLTCNLTQLIEMAAAVVISIHLLKEKMLSWAASWPHLSTWGWDDPLSRAILHLSWHEMLTTWTQQLWDPYRSFLDKAYSKLIVFEKVSWMWITDTFTEALKMVKSTHTSSPVTVVCCRCFSQIAVSGFQIAVSTDLDVKQWVCSPASSRTQRFSRDSSSTNQFSIASMQVSSRAFFRKSYSSSFAS